MRWIGSTYGDERTVTRFAIVPMRINGQIVWLEKVRVHQSWGTFGSIRWHNDWIEK